LKIKPLTLEKIPVIVSAFEKTDTVDSGVGLYADYGNAQKLYVKRGYIPDGFGLTYENKPVESGHQVRVDDELLIWMVKVNKAS